jgi:hypothetical protein
MKPGSEAPRFTRRAYLRLTILAATGLSLFPGCRTGGGSGGGTGDAARTPLEKWARLGQIWRDMTAHLKQQRGAEGKAKAAFEKLKRDTGEALDAVSASPELRELFETRWAHISRVRYIHATCYAPLPPGTPQPQFEIEKQVEQLEKLVADGKLTKKTAAKAARVLAVQAQYLVAGTPTQELREEYNAGTLKPGADAKLAGKRVAEITADQLGLLAGPPKENESAAQPKQ